MTYAVLKWFSDNLGRFLHNVPFGVLWPPTALNLPCLSPGLWWCRLPMSSLLTWCWSHLVSMPSMDIRRRWGATKCRPSVSSLNTSSVPHWIICKDTHANRRLNVRTHTFKSSWDHTLWKKIVLDKHNWDLMVMFL